MIINPVFAEENLTNNINKNEELVVSKEFCKKLLGGVEYIEGVDVNGKSVTPAGLDTNTVIADEVPANLNTNSVIASEAWQSRNDIAIALDIADYKGLDKEGKGLDLGTINIESQDIMAKKHQMIQKCKALLNN